jgi:hypothetical protein
MIDTIGFYSLSFLIIKMSDITDRLALPPTYTVTKKTDTFINIILKIQTNSQSTPHYSTSESASNQKISFESTLSNNFKATKFLKDIYQGYCGRPANPSRTNTSKSKFEEDMKKIGIDTKSLIDENFRISVNLGSRAKKRKSFTHLRDYISKSRQSKFRMNDELATSDMGSNSKEMLWRVLDDSPSQSCKDDMNPMISYCRKKKANNKMKSTSDQLKKAIFSMKEPKKQDSNLDRKKQKAYMNIINLIYSNHIKNKKSG